MNLKEALFSGWCKSQRAETTEDLTQLILLESSLRSNQILQTGDLLKYGEILELFNL